MFSRTRRRSLPSGQHKHMMILLYLTPGKLQIKNHSHLYCNVEQQTVWFMLDFQEALGIKQRKALLQTEENRSTHHHYPAETDLIGLYQAENTSYKQNSMNLPSATSSRVSIAAHNREWLWGFCQNHKLSDQLVFFTSTF